MELAKDYRDRRRILRLCGALMLLAGVGVGLLAPIEMYSFYLFSEGGPFYYEGFGFGSLMFANIAIQIAGYYVIAALALVLGIGHLKVRRWARVLAEALLWSWLVVGAPLVVLAFGILLTAKELSLVGALIGAAAFAALYLVVPGLLLWFYRSRDVRLTFAAHDGNTSWIEAMPMPALVLLCLSVFYAIVLHFPILFNGFYPLFGSTLTGLEGIVALTLSIACLVLIACGVAGLKRWAWWASLLYWLLLAATLIVTLALTSWEELLSLMVFAPLEMEALSGVPLQGYHLAAFLGLPLLLTVGVVLLSRRSFGTRRTAESSAPEQVISPSCD